METSQMFYPCCFRTSSVSFRGRCSVSGVQAECSTKGDVPSKKSWYPSHFEKSWDTLSRSLGSPTALRRHRNRPPLSRFPRILALEDRRSTRLDHHSSHSGSQMHNKCRPLAAVAFLLLV